MEELCEATLKPLSMEDWLAWSPEPGVLYILLGNMVVIDMEGFESVVILEDPDPDVRRAAALKDYETRAL